MGEQQVSFATEFTSIAYLGFHFHRPRRDRPDLQGAEPSGAPGRSQRGETRGAALVRAGHCLYIADHIARGSLKRAPREDGLGAGDAQGGWTWRFDPFQWRDMRMENPVPDFLSLQCPVAIVWGSHSMLFDAEVLARIASLAPP